LDDIEGIETSAGRPGTAAEGGFQGHVAMRADGQAAVERLLARRVAGDADRDTFPSLEPPEQAASAQ